MNGPSRQRSVSGQHASTAPPPTAVLRAFGVDDDPEPMVGGQGRSWAAGGLVFKPGGGPTYEWLGEALRDVVTDEVRLARPVPADRDAWSVEGWTAARWVDGRHPDHAVTSTWNEILEAGRAFHRAMAHLGRPTCLDTRDDPWAVADRVAWAERTIEFRPEFADLVRRLTAGLHPLGRPQIVHGDLTGNVLLAPGMTPAVIDISPYWRPPAYADGIVMADALCWHGAHRSLLDQTGVPVEAVARGLLFRMATTNVRADSGVGELDLDDEAQRYERAITEIGL